jgi:hypothetical protein
MNASDGKRESKGRAKRAAKPKLGRPPMPPGERRSEVISVRATGEQAERLEELAATWGTDRRGAVIRAIDEAHARNRKRIDQLHVRDVMNRAKGDARAVRAAKREG